MEILTGEEAVMACLNAGNLPETRIPKEIRNTLESRHGFKSYWYLYGNFPQSAMVRRDTTAEYVWLVLGQKPCYLKTLGQYGQGNSVRASTLEHLKELMASEEWNSLGTYMAQAEVGSTDGWMIYFIGEQNVCSLGVLIREGRDFTRLDEQSANHFLHLTNRVALQLKEYGHLGFVECKIRLDQTRGGLWMTGVRLELVDVDRDHILGVANDTIDNGIYREMVG